MASFKIFAGTETGLRDNNEDNFIVNPNLNLDRWTVPTNQQETINLGEKGCMIVVADGMGGLNAGEVASDIAVNTVKEWFSAERIPAHVAEQPQVVKSYLKSAVVEADKRIKEYSKTHPETEGMGSTIIMAWLLGNYVYVCWLGDSRAYSYVPGKGIARLSKDHSYVQELVDAKILTEEKAMTHQLSNVVTRSLGDTGQSAKPDVICHEVVEGEIILLCSDGLCGVCTDETIGCIIEQSSDDLRDCKDTLTNAALNAGGSDNITIALLQIISTIRKAESLPTPLPFWEGFKRNLTVFSISAVLVIALVLANLEYCGKSGKIEEQRERKDSIDAKKSDKGKNKGNNNDATPPSGESRDSTSSAPPTHPKKIPGGKLADDMPVKKNQDSLGMDGDTSFDSLSPISGAGSSITLIDSSTNYNKDN
ncbi:MAG: serine/threonine-protein phosphatase [Bacteroidaceae bacterium]|nr:serine/threonine-protein phosphatase [Bacteroidaceae bacterium]